MKSLIYIAVLMGLALLLGSCGHEEPWTHQSNWLCSINSDGTGFKMLQKDLLNIGARDMFMTSDDKIIMYGKRLWITDPEVISLMPITPSDFELWRQPARLSQSRDGSKFYFAANTEIYQLSYPDYQLTMLTNEQVRLFRNPIVSDLGNFITYSSTGYGYPLKDTDYLYCMNLKTGLSSLINTTHSANDSVACNAYYSETEDYVYYENYGLHRSKLDGSQYSIVDGSGSSYYPYSCYQFSGDGRHVLRFVDVGFNPRVRCYDLKDNTAVEFDAIVDVLSGPKAKMSMNANKVFYAKPRYGSDPFSSTLVMYDLDTDTVLTLFDTIGDITIDSVVMLAPTWDGSKVYFYAELSELNESRE